MKITFTCPLLSTQIRQAHKPAEGWECPECGGEALDWAITSQSTRPRDICLDCTATKIKQAAEAVAHLAQFQRP